MINKKYYKTESGFRDVYKEYLESWLSVENFCKDNRISQVTFYKYKKLYKISRNDYKESEITLTPVSVSNEESSIVSINGLSIETNNIDDNSLLRILKVIRKL